MKYPINTKVTNQIRQYRHQKGLSQKQFAQLIGKSQQYYSKIEKGKVLLDLDIIFSIAKQLEVSIGVLLEETQVAADEKTSVTDTIRQEVFFQIGWKNPNLSSARTHPYSSELDFRKEIIPQVQSQSIQHFHPHIPHEKIMGLQHAIAALQKELNAILFINSDTPQKMG